MKKLAFVVLLICWQSTTLSAASFQCSDAKTAIEKMICSDPTISNLDDTLYITYKIARDSSDNPSLVIKSQKKWLAQIRAQCKTRECLANVYKDRIMELQSFKKYSWIKYTDKKLNIEFMYPGYLTVLPDYNDNSVKVIGASMEGSDYFIHFEIHPGDFEAGISESDIFEQRGEVWYAHIGGFENPPAEAITGQGWKGIRTIITCGISDKETGFHAAAGECFWAVISNGEKYLVADTQGIIGTDDNTMKLFMSVQFIR